MSPKKRAKRSAKVGKPAKDGGLFISRAMRRSAEAAAAAELQNLQSQTDEYADTQDREAYDARYPERTDVEKAHWAEQSQNKATEDARKKFHLDKPVKASPR